MLCVAELCVVENNEKKKKKSFTAHTADFISASLGGSVLETNCCVFWNQFVSISGVRFGPSPELYYKVTANTLSEKSPDTSHWQQL